MADKCKYQKLQYQVSYDNGSTWQDVTPIQVKKGDIIEYMSRDCGESETLYRWVDLEGTYICDGNNKYTRQIQEESYDNGVSWYATYPTVYKQGTFVGVDADYCCDKFIGHYTVVDTSCPRWYKWNGFKCAYVDPIKIVKCNDDSTLRSGETIYYGSSNYSLVDGEIGDSVTAIGDNAFQGFNYLSRINSNTDGLFNIPTGITSIGDYAFNGCQSLTSVTIPNGVTYIGEYAFRDCSGLTSVNIPTGVTTIHDSTFRDCVSLTSVTIPNGVTTIEKNAFISCRGLTSIVLPSSITSIGDSAFTYSNNLTSITCLSMTPPTLGTNAFASTKNSPIYVPCGSVDAYKSATYWSSYASRIEGIPPCGMPQDGKFFAIYSDSSSYLAVCDENTELTSATTRAHSTSYTAMTSAEIGNCITSIGYAAFQNCSSLTSCTIPTSVTSINEEAFAYCTSLTSIIIPNSVTSIGLDAFYLCTSLTSVTIPSGVTSIGQYAFGACYNLTSITILAATPPTLEYNNVFDSDCPIYVPCKSVDTYKSATYWSSYASRIEGIPPCGMPQDGKLITIYSDSSFYSAACDSNTTLTSGDTKPNGYEYTAMTSAEIGACITSIGNSAFSGCTSLLEVVIPSGVTSIGNEAFKQCTSLTSVSIPSGVTSIGDSTFSGCTSLTSCTIPNSVTSIGNEAFTYCSRITSIDIPSGVTSIGHHAFYYCTGLTSVSIPSGITSIGAWTFTNCYSLTSVTIPNSVTSIGENAFWSCNSLTSITIPSGVTSIGLTAFGSCYSLTSVTILATTPPALDNPFYNRNKDLLIYVPCSSVDTYRTDINWRGYASIILGIPPCVEPTPTPTGATKFNAIYPNGVQYFVYCDSNPELTTTTTRGGQFDYAKIRSAEIGSCITSIGNSAFSDFDSLSSITIPNSVTEIKYMAFRWCYSLTSITIPDSVTSIGDSAFYGCSGLTSVTVNATTPPALGSNAFSSTSSNLVIYVPSTSVDAYKTSWGGLANRIQAIP